MHNKFAKYLQYFCCCSSKTPEIKQKVCDDARTINVYKKREMERERERKSECEKQQEAKIRQKAQNI